MKTILALLFLAVSAFSQSTSRWAATTGDVSLNGAGTTATIQQLAIDKSSQAFIDQIVVYCSVACSITQAANGAAATATAGTITPILPTQLNLSIPLTFW